MKPSKKNSFNYIPAIIASISILVKDIHTRKASEDAYLNFTQLAYKYGHACEEYDVTTKDGYVLKLFRIPGNTRQPVLLMHGLGDCADTFIIRGNVSLAITLATAGYDVWAGNMRGNKYTRHHLTLNPDKNKEFWNFSVDEISVYDLPALTDFILNFTGNDKLQAIGHSEGTTVFYVLGAMRPEYNDKYSVLISLAPIAYLHNTKHPLSEIIKVGPVVNKLLEDLGVEELFGSHSAARALLNILCATNELVGYTMCAEGIFFRLAGRDSRELEPDFYPTAVRHYAAGTSRKNLMHMDQVGLRKRFARYDYGETENLVKYGTSEPPEYNLTKVRMPIALFVGKNDKIATVADVLILKSKLPNVVVYREMERGKFNHLDFVWGKNMDLYLHPSIFEVLDKYN